jgi:hypothetical protein
MDARVVVRDLRPHDIPAYTAYGSSVDNVSGDGWYSKAQAAYPNNER